MKILNRLMSYIYPFQRKQFQLKHVSLGDNFYADITKFLKFLGYSVTIIENKILLKKKKQFIHLQMVKKVVISDNNQLFKRK